MSNIITTTTRRYFNVKPPLGSTLNRSHPLAQGMVALFALNEGGGNLVNNLVQTGNGIISGQKWIFTSKGVGLNFSANHIDCGSNSKLSTTVFTKVIWGIFTANGDNIIAAYDSAGNVPELRHSNLQLIAIEANHAGLVSSSSNIPSGVPSQVAWSYAANGDNNIYINGKNVGYANNVRSWSTGLIYCLGGNTGDPNLTGKLILSLQYNRALSPSEIQSLYVAPYQMIAPQRRYVSYSIPSGAVGVKKGSVAKIQSIRGISNLTL